jgi:hypothetical protein
MAKVTHKMAEKGQINPAKAAAKPAKPAPAVAAAVAAKAPSKKYLEKVPESVVFWCHDGQIFRDLNDLINGFDLMTDDTFWYHANDEKNDFSCWILDVIGDEDLAKDVKKVKTRSQAKKVTQQHYYDLTKLEG